MTLTKFQINGVTFLLCFFCAFSVNHLALLIISTPSTAVVQVGCTREIPEYFIPYLPNLVTSTPGVVRLDKLKIQVRAIDTDVLR